MDKMNNLYRWVKWSDKIPDRQYNYHVKVFYHSGNGIYNSTAYFNGVTFIDSTQTNYGNPILINVSEWLEPIEENEQDKLWDAIRVLAMEDEFREYNGQYCPEGFNVYKFIKKLSSKYYLLEKS